MNLDELREKIDAVDLQIASSFQNRMDLVKQVAQFKKENNLPILQSSRESEIIAKIAQNQAYEQELTSLYKSIFNISKARQEQENKPPFKVDKPSVATFSQSSKIGCQGDKGAYSHLCSTRVFPCNDVHFYQTFEQVFLALQNKEIDFGILPIENSIAGSVNEIYELMQSYECFIVANYTLEINHYLLGNTVDISKIKTVYSHSHALNQCNKFIKKNNFSTHNLDNTALSAKYVATNGKEHEACICSKLCASIYGLNVIESNIQNANSNFTRFIIVSNSHNVLADANIINLSLTIKNEKDSLSKLLSIISGYDCNLLKLESRNIPNTNFNIKFFLDIEGNISDKKIKAMLNALSANSECLKYLGCSKNFN